MRSHVLPRRSKTYDLMLRRYILYSTEKRIFFDPFLLNLLYPRTVSSVSKYFWSWLVIPLLPLLIYWINVSFEIFGRFFFLFVFPPVWQWGVRTTSACTRRRHGGWSSKSLMIGHSVKVLVQCVIWFDHFIS